MAQGPRRGNRRDAPGACAIQSTRLDCGQVGRVVSGRARSRRQAQHRHCETLLAIGLAQAARQAHRVIGRHESADSPGGQRRPSCDRPRTHVAHWPARPWGQPRQCRTVRPHRHAPRRLAIGAARHRRAAANPHRPGRADQTGRTARVHHRRLHARQDPDAVLQMGRQQGFGREH